MLLSTYILVILAKNRTEEEILRILNKNHQIKQLEIQEITLYM